MYIDSPYPKINCETTFKVAFSALVIQSKKPNTDGLLDQNTIESIFWLYHAVKFQKFAKFYDPYS